MDSVEAASWTQALGTIVAILALAWQVRDTKRTRKDMNKKEYEAQASSVAGWVSARRVTPEGSLGHEYARLLAEITNYGSHPIFDVEAWVEYGNHSRLATLSRVVDVIGPGADAWSLEWPDRPNSELMLAEYPSLLYEFTLNNRRFRVSGAGVETVGNGRRQFALWKRHFSSA